MDRISRLIDRHGEVFLRRWFSEGEIEYCSGKAYPERHFAARIAAKEAVVKTLRPSWDGPVLLSDIEIVHDESGAPEVRLSGVAGETAKAACIATIQVSLSHGAGYATAVALAEPCPHGWPAPI